MGILLLNRPEPEDMALPRLLALLSVLALVGLSDAAAQFPPPPGPAKPAAQPQSSPFPPPPGQSGASQQSQFPPAPGQSGTSQQSPFPAAPGQAGRTPPRATGFPPPGGGTNVCEQFPPIRDQTEKDGGAIKAASDRKAAREEICALFTKFVASETRMVKFLETNQAACGVPPDAIKHVKAQQVKSQQIRKQVCSAGPAARGPSLSDALSGPALPDEAPKPGRGTFDTLTGSPLAR